MRNPKRTNPIPSPATPSTLTVQDLAAVIFALTGTKIL